MENNLEPMDVDTSITAVDSVERPSEDDHEVHVSDNEKVNISDLCYENRGGTFSNGINTITEQQQLKMKERAKRFGLQDKQKKSHSRKIEDIYSSVGTIEEDKCAKKLRLNVFHVRGTEDTNTEDVFDYLEDYVPATIELISDISCLKDIVTESRKRMYKKKDYSEKQIDDEFSNEEGPTKRSKNPWGVLSETWGQNDSVEDNFPRLDPDREAKSNIKERLGIKSHVKEILIPSVPSSFECNGQSIGESSDEDWCKRSKVLRMRMHADDEEEKMMKKRIKQRMQKVNASMENKNNDLRSRLNDINKMYRVPIQVVVDNAMSMDCRQQSSYTLEEGEDEIVKLLDEGPEEGEYNEESEDVQEPFDKESDEDSHDTDISDREIQGPKGSVIKVVSREKPRVASTVWARLNNTKLKANMKDRPSSKGDLKRSSPSDIRSRLGYHNRSRSPLRIEVKNDQYAKEPSTME